MAHKVNRKANKYYGNVFSTFICSFIKFEFLVAQVIHLNHDITKETN